MDGSGDGAGREDTGVQSVMGKNKRQSQTGAPALLKNLHIYSVLFFSLLSKPLRLSVPDLRSGM